jgi:pimeloyl-ACP methyl ester carboxylesterase
MLAADQALDLSKVKLPVTIIWGRYDAITPLSDGQKMHQSINGSEIHIIEDARHSPVATKPMEVADIIMGALGR